MQRQLLEAGDGRHHLDGSENAIRGEEPIHLPGKREPGFVVFYR